MADAAVGGGHWIVSLDDSLRAKLRARDASALEEWRRVSSYLKFAERHASWRTVAPYGNVGFVLDAASTKQELADEYLNLMTRRQVAYRLVARSGLNAAAVAKFRAIVATELDPPTAAERKLLQDFAEDGGLVIAGPSWGDAPKTEPFAEIPAGKGRVAVYKDPDPETVARDLKELLSDADLGSGSVQCAVGDHVRKGRRSRATSARAVSQLFRPSGGGNYASCGGQISLGSPRNAGGCGGGPGAAGRRGKYGSDNSEAFVMGYGFDGISGL